MHPRLVKMKSYRIDAKEISNDEIEYGM